MFHKAYDLSTHVGVSLLFYFTLLYLLRNYLGSARYTFIIIQFRIISKLRFVEKLKFCKEYLQYKCTYVQNTTKEYAKNKIFRILSLVQKFCILI